MTFKIFFDKFDQFADAPDAVDELMALCDRLALQQQERETRHRAAPP